MNLDKFKIPTLEECIYSNVWHCVLKYVYNHMLLIKNDSYIIVAVKREDKICFVLYYKCGEKYYKNELPHPAEYEVDETDAPIELREELNSHNEVVVRKDKILCCEL